MNPCRASLLFALFLLLTFFQAFGQPRFLISFSKERSTVALDGRMLLIVSADSTAEPRLQIDHDAGLNTQQIFGIDVEGLQPDVDAVIDRTVLGFPRRSSSEIPAGDYWVQALLHKYETFHRSDGYVVKLPMDRGEGQQWNEAPGNLYSTPRKIRLLPGANDSFRIILEKEIPPIEPAKDTKYIKHVRIRSERLSKFWGRDMYLGASVLLPYGWDNHPEARYPLVVYQTHFGPTFTGFSETPPDPNLKPE